MGKCCDRKNADIAGLTSDFCRRLEILEDESDTLRKQLAGLRVTNERQHAAAVIVIEEKEGLEDAYESQIEDLEEENEILRRDRDHLLANMTCCTDRVLELEGEVATLQHILQNPVAMHNQITTLMKAVKAMEPANPA